MAQQQEQKAERLTQSKNPYEVTDELRPRIDAMDLWGVSTDSARKATR